MAPAPPVSPIGGKDSTLFSQKVLGRNFCYQHGSTYGKKRRAGMLLGLLDEEERRDNQSIGREG